MSGTPSKLKKYHLSYVWPRKQTQLLFRYSHSILIKSPFVVHEASLTSIGYISMATRAQAVPISSFSLGAHNHGLGMGSPVYHRHCPFVFLPLIQTLVYRKRTSDGGMFWKRPLVLMMLIRLSWSDWFLTMASPDPFSHSNCASLYTRPVLEPLATAMYREVLGNIWNIYWFQRDELIYTYSHV